MVVCHIYVKVQGTVCKSKCTVLFTNSKTMKHTIRHVTINLVLTHLINEINVTIKKIHGYFIA